jgi:hypothetical protein
MLLWHFIETQTYGHVTIQEIGGRLRLGIIADNRDRNRT